VHQLFYRDCPDVSSGTSRAAYMKISPLINVACNQAEFLTCDTQSSRGTYTGLEEK
jgi:hypothetical protein